MMLGGRLLQAAVLLAPTLISARSILSINQTPAHLVTYAQTPYLADIYLGNHEDQYDPPQLLATLNVENFESIPCDASSITIDGEPLSQDQDGSGHGVFTTEHESNFGATWTLKCLEDSPDKLTFAITSIDRVVVHGIEFEVKIKRGVPPEIVSVSGLDHFTESDGLEFQLAQLEKLEAELSALKNKISLKQQSGRPSYNGAQQRPLTDAESCDTVKCRLNGYLSRVFKHIGSAVESAYPSSDVESKQKPISGYGEGRNAVQKTMGTPSSDGIVQPESSAQEPTIHHQPPTKIHAPKDPRYYALLLAAALTGILIISLILVVSHSACRCRGERRETCLTRRQRRQDGRHCQQETEKPIEPKTTISSMLKARGTEALSWIQASLQRRRIADEEKDALSHEQVDSNQSSNDIVALRVAIPPHPQSFSRHPSVEIPKSARQSFASLRPADTDSGDDSDHLSTTMEQELAQFRAVAGMVESIVAAGSARTPGSASSARKQRKRAQSSASTSSGRSWRPRTPPSPSTTLPSYHSEEEYPPDYESGPDDEPRDFVADGFQYHVGDRREPEDNPYQGRPLPPMTGESTLDEHLGRKE